jgi:superfamily II DNA helicase RecQ
MVVEAYGQVLKYIQTKFPKDTGIVYCMTKADCEEMSDFLKSNQVCEV